MVQLFRPLASWTSDFLVVVLVVYHARRGIADEEDDEYE
jgi:hypothetical protein